MIEEREARPTWKPKRPSQPDITTEARKKEIRAGRLETRLDSMTIAGYELYAPYGVIPAYESVARVVQRFADGGPNGRWVPPEVVRIVAASIPETWRRVTAHPRVRHFWRYDMMPKPPTLLDEVP